MCASCDNLKGDNSYILMKDLEKYFVIASLRTGLLMEFVWVLTWPYFEDKSNWLGEASNLICKAEFSKFCKPAYKILWIKFVYKPSRNFSTEQNCVERIKLIIMKGD